jgi:hypothetical protein
VRVDSMPWELTEQEKQAVVEDLMMQEEALSPLEKMGSV